MQQKDIYQELLTLIIARWQGLPDKPEENPENTLQALWLLAAGVPCAVQRVSQVELPGLDSAQIERLRQDVAKRLDGTPLAYLTGRQVFMGIEMLAGPGAMIPRKETEILGTAALKIARRLSEERGQINVVDLCTGSGNIALTLAKEIPAITVWGIDITAEAVSQAQENARFLNLESRVQFLEGDLLAPLDSSPQVGHIDLITCNPPYISTAQAEKMAPEISQHEPRQAFDGGSFGIKIITRLLREAPRFLTAQGWLCFEVGLGQGKNLSQMLAKQAAFTDVETVTDDKGEIRVLAARLMSRQV